jgi:hypothetical protein
MEVSGQLHASSALLWKIAQQYPLDTRLAWPQSWSGRYGEEKILPLLGTNPGLPANGRRYTDRAIQAHNCKIMYN